MRIAIPVIILLLGFQNLDAQTLRAYLKAADEAMVEKDYYTAYYHLQTAHEISPKDASIQYQFAEAANAFRAYSMADSLYQMVYSGSSATRYADLGAKWAQVKQQLGDYAAADSLFQTYLTNHEGADEMLTKLAKTGLESSAWAKDNMDIDSTIKIEKLGAGVNTIYSEFSPIRNGDYLYFSSVRYESMKEDDTYPKPLYSRVLKSEDMTGEGEALDSVLNEITKHTGHLTFAESQDRLYYTLCDYNDEMEIVCELYFRDIDGDDWGDAQKLPFPINDTTGTSTQPNIGFDEKSGKDVLYFVSDRDGGEGGLDIWYAIMDDKDSFSEPVNLSDINTVMDDISPFYHKKTTSLLFSSNGRVGYGGHDVYRSYQSNEDWMEPENMMAGVNSPLDDINFTLSEDEDLGFVSSNRLGSSYIQDQAEACCYDIYQVELKPIELKLKVETYDAITLEPLPNVTIYLTQNGNQNDVLVTQTMGNTNEALIDLNRNKNYLLVGDRDGYEPDSATFTTVRLEESQEIVQKLYLDPSQLVLEVRAFGLRNKQPLPRVNMQLTQPTSGETQNGYNPSGHRVFFTIDREEDYNLLATKKGYLKAELDFNSGRNLGMDTLVKEIFLELGNLEDFLPLAIYFDNDHPDPRSKASTTNKNYQETYDAYTQKRPLFKRKYGKGNVSLEAEVDDFYNNSLLRGKQELESFKNILDQYLEEGLEFKIFLKGYASPLASDAYNLAIGGRRINSIQNEFATFRGGILMKYIQSGALEVLEKSFGEGDAPTNVSDSAQDTRQSIYSPAASKERRVEIIEIEKEEN